MQRPKPYKFVVSEFSRDDYVLTFSTNFIVSRPIKQQLKEDIECYISEDKTQIIIAPATPVSGDYACKIRDDGRIKDSQALKWIKKQRGMNIEENTYRVKGQFLKDDQGKYFVFNIANIQSQKKKTRKCSPAKF